MKEKRNLALTVPQVIKGKEYNVHSQTTAYIAITSYKATRPLYSIQYNMDQGSFGGPAFASRSPLEIFPPIENTLVKERYNQGRIERGHATAIQMRC